MRGDFAHLADMRHGEAVCTADAADHWVIGLGEQQREGGGLAPNASSQAPQINLMIPKGKRRCRGWKGRHSTSRDEAKSATDKRHG